MEEEVGVPVHCEEEGCDATELLHRPDMRAPANEIGSSGFGWHVWYDEHGQLHYLCPAHNDAETIRHHLAMTP